MGLYDAKYETGDSNEWLQQRKLETEGGLSVAEWKARRDEARGETGYKPDVSVNRLGNAVLEELKQGVRHKLIGVGLVEQSVQDRASAFRKRRAEELGRLQKKLGQKIDRKKENVQYKDAAVEVLAAASAPWLEADPSFNVSSGFLENQIRSLTQVGQQLLTGTLGGPAIAIQDMGLMIMGGTYTKLKRENPDMPDERAKQAAFLNTAGQAPVEYAGMFANKIPGLKQGVGWINNLSKPLQQKVTSALQKKALGAITWLTSRATPEFVTEVFQNITAEQLSELWAKNPDGAIMEEWGEVLSEADTWKEALAEGGHAALSTIILRGGARASQAATSRARGSVDRVANVVKAEQQGEPVIERTEERPLTLFEQEQRADAIAKENEQKRLKRKKAKVAAREKKAKTLKAKAEAEDAAKEAADMEADLATAFSDLSKKANKLVGTQDAPGTSKVSDIVATNKEVAEVEASLAKIKERLAQAEALETPQAEEAAAMEKDLAEDTKAIKVEPKEMGGIDALRKAAKQQQEEEVAPEVDVKPEVEAAKASYPQLAKVGYQDEDGNVVEVSKVPVAKGAGVHMKDQDLDVIADGISKAKGKAGDKPFGFIVDGKIVSQEAVAQKITKGEDLEDVTLDKKGKEIGKGARFRAKRGAAAEKVRLRKEKEDIDAFVKKAKEVKPLTKKQEANFNAKLQSAKGAARRITKKNPSDFTDVVQEIISPRKGVGLLDFVRKSKKEQNKILGKDKNGKQKTWKPGFLARNAMRDMILSRGQNKSRIPVEQQQFDEGKIAGKDVAVEEEVQQSAQSELERVGKQDMTNRPDEEEGMRRLAAEAKSKGKDVKGIKSEQDLIEEEGEALNVKVDVTKPDETLAAIEEGKKEAAGDELSAFERLELMVRGTLVPKDISKGVAAVAESERPNVLKELIARREADLARKAEQAKLPKSDKAKTVTAEFTKPTGEKFKASPKKDKIPSTIVKGKGKDTVVSKLKPGSARGLAPNRKDIRQAVNRAKLSDTRVESVDESLGYTGLVTGPEIEQVTALNKVQQGAMDAKVVNVKSAYDPEKTVRTGYKSGKPFPNREAAQAAFNSKDTTPGGEFEYARIVVEDVPYARPKVTRVNGKKVVKKTRLVYWIENRKPFTGKIRPKVEPGQNITGTTAKKRVSVDKAIEEIDSSRRKHDAKLQGALELIEGTPEYNAKQIAMRERAAKREAQVAKQNATKAEKRKVRAAKKRKKELENLGDVFSGQSIKQTEDLDAAADAFLEAADAEIDAKINADTKAESEAKTKMEKAAAIFSNEKGEVVIRQGVDIGTTKTVLQRSDLEKLRAEGWTWKQASLEQAPGLGNRPHKMWRMIEPTPGLKRPVILVPPKRKLQSTPSIVKNQRGGMEITIPGIDQAMAIPRKIGQTWVDAFDKVEVRTGKWIASAAKKSTKLDYVLTRVVEKYGLGQDLVQLQQDKELQLHRMKMLATTLGKEIEKIDSVFTSSVGTAFGNPKTGITRDFLAGKKGDQLKAAKKALEKRKRQVAEGSISSFGPKYASLDLAAKKFSEMEKQLRDAGLLNDHQFRSLNKRERAAALADVKKIEDKILDVQTKAWSPLKKQKATIKLEKSRRDILARLQIHYKNSGTNYLRYISDEVSQNERYAKRFKMDAMSKKFTKRRQNWTVKVDDTGTVHTKRTKRKNLKNTSELVSKGLSQEAHDLHMHEMFLNISKSEEDMEVLGLDAPWATKNPDQYKDVRYTRIPKLHQHFGPLAGMYVENHIHADLQNTFKDQTEFEKKVSEIFSNWKAGKTVWNPATQARNLISNIGLAHVIGDVNFFNPKTFKQFWGAVQDGNNIYNGLAPTSEYGMEVMNDTTIYSRTFTQAELGQHKDYITELSKIVAEASPTDGIAKMVEWAGKVGPRAYDLMETSMKSVVYAQARQRGMSKTEAGNLANKALFDYGSVPAAIRWTRQYYSPFVTFTYKALPALAKSVLRKPWKLAPYYGLSLIAENVANMVLGDDEEEMEAKRAVLPDYIDRNILPGMPSHVRIPFRTEDGRDKYLDISFFTPWGGFSEMGDGALSWVPSLLLPNTPVLTVPAAFLSDVDLFTRQPITLETDSAGTKVWKVLAKITAEVAPGMVSPQKFEKLVGAIHGDRNIMGDPKYSVADAILDWAVGIKFRNVDYMEQSMWRQKDIQKKADELRIKYRKEYNDITNRKAGRHSEESSAEALDDLMYNYMEQYEDIKQEYHERFMMENDNE